MDKLIITVAPTGSVPRKKDTPHVPVTPDEIAETAYRCEQEGASIIHVHCRDENERTTSRFEIFQETVEKIRKRTKLVVMTSTSGIAAQTDEDRATPLRTRPEMGSLTTGTLNFAGRKPSVVYVNTPETVQFLAKAMFDQHIKPELEAFDVGFVHRRSARDHGSRPATLRSGEAGQTLLERFEGLADCDLVVGCGKIERLSRFHENPSRQEGRIDDAPLRFVRGERVSIVARRLIREQDGEDRAHRGNHRGSSMVLQEPLEPGSQGARRLQQTVERPRLLELIERRHAGRHRDGIPGERAAVEELPARRVREVEDIRPSEEGPAGKAASDDLAQTRQAGRHALGMLGPAERDAKAAHHLVEDQGDIVVRRDLPQSVEEVRFGRDVRPLDGFQNDAGETVRVAPNPRG